MITYSFAQIYRKKLMSAHLGSRLQNDRVFNDGKTSVEELHQKVRKLSGLQTERRSKMYSRYQYHLFAFRMVWMAGEGEKRRGMGRREGLGR